MRATLSFHFWGSKSHLDLFLEVENRTSLLTYSCFLDELEKFHKKEFINFTQKQDHRLLYLDYEGLVSNDRGFIKIIWKGKYKEKVYNKSLIKVKFEKEKLYIAI